MKTENNSSNTNTAFANFTATFGGSWILSTSLELFFIVFRGFNCSHSLVALLWVILLQIKITQQWVSVLFITRYPVDFDSKLKSSVEKSNTKKSMWGVIGCDMEVRGDIPPVVPILSPVVPICCPNCIISSLCLASIRKIQWVSVCIKQRGSCFSIKRKSPSVKRGLILRTPGEIRTHDLLLRRQALCTCFTEDRTLNL